jgi:hypothetical protein
VKCDSERKRASLAGSWVPAELLANDHCLWLSKPDVRRKSLRLIVSMPPVSRAIRQRQFFSMETTLWKISFGPNERTPFQSAVVNSRRPLDRPTLFRFQFGPMHISVPFIRPERANLVFTLHFQKRVQNFWRLRAHTAGRLMALVFWNSRTLPSNLLLKRKAHFLIPQILSFKMSRKSFLPKLSVSNRRGPFSIQCPSCDYFHRALFDIAVRF